MFTGAAILGLIILGFFIGICIFLFVPWLIGKTAGVVGGTVTSSDYSPGCLGSIVLAILGAIVGHWLFGNFGPRVFDIHIVPAFLGALILSIVFSAIFGSRRRY
jgi:uncharacterized membrane protein YeaQ/YmgE (transglycosylase-associated protein family)